MSQLIKAITLFTILSIIVSSCSDFENTIYINADGSGKVHMRYDASEMLAMADMMKEMGGEMEKEEEDIILDGMDDDGNLNSLLDGFNDPTNITDMDTTFTFYEVLPDSLKNSLGQAELLKKISMSINSSEAEKISIMEMELEYQSLDELEQTYEMLKALAKEGNEDVGEMNGFKDLIRNYDADLNKGIVILPEQDFSGSFGEGAVSEDVDFSNMSEEESGMMEMMFGNAGYVTTLHLPGEVTSCDDPEAIIEGNVVTIRDTYMTMMKDNKLKARTIKFKVN